MCRQVLISGDEGKVTVAHVLARDGNGNLIVQFPSGHVTRKGKVKKVTVKVNAADVRPYNGEEIS